MYEKRSEGWYYFLMLIVLAAGLLSSWYFYHLGNVASAKAQDASELTLDQLAETLKQDERLFVYFTHQTVRPAKVMKN